MSCLDAISCLDAGIPAHGYRWYKSDMDTDISVFLRRVARGRNGSEHLQRHEAATVLAALLSPGADQLQLGAFLIAERMKGESSEELAGFVDAARRHIKGFGESRVPQGAVDMPCYAGKRRAAPVHLAAALQARDAGIPVVLHGLEHIAGRLSAWQAVQAAGVSRAGTLDEGLRVLADQGIVYMDLADICPPLFALTALRPRLGVRTFAHTVARLLNPLQCEGQLNGVFHTPYVALMAEVNVLLNQARSLVFMGAEGDPELYADRQKLLAAQQGSETASLSFPGAHCELYPREAGESPEEMLQRFTALQNGGMDTREKVTLQRMAEAFVFASSGMLPHDWIRDE